MPPRPRVFQASGGDGATGGLTSIFVGHAWGHFKIKLVVLSVPQNLRAPNCVSRFRNSRTTGP